MSDRNTQTESFDKALEVLKRRFWRFALVAGVVCAIVLLCGFFLPRQYEAEAIFERQNDMVLNEIVNRGATRAEQDSKQSLHQEISGEPAIAAFIESVRQDSPLGRPLTELELAQLEKELKYQLTVEYDIASAQTQRVRLRLISEDPVLAREAVNGLIESYMHRVREDVKKRLNESSIFFRQEATQLRRTIAEMEDRKLRFEIEHAELLPDSPLGLDATMEMVRTELLELRDDEEALEAKRDALVEALADEPETRPSVRRGRNPKLDELEAQRRELQSQVALFQGVYKMTPKHPDLVALRERITGVDKLIAATEQEVVVSREFIPNPRRGDLKLEIRHIDSELAAIDRRRTALNETLNSMNDRHAELFPVRSAYLKLSREVEEARRQLAFWEDNLRRVEMTLAAETGNRGVQLRFILPCAEIARPVSPDLVQLLIAALGLSVLGGVVAVFIAERNDRTFRSPTQLTEALQIPLIGSVSEIISDGDRHLRRARHSLALPLYASLMFIVIGGITLVLRSHLRGDENVFATAQASVVDAVIDLTQDPRGAAPRQGSD